MTIRKVMQRMREIIEDLELSEPGPEKLENLRDAKALRIALKELELMQHIRARLRDSE